MALLWTIAVLTASVNGIAALVPTMPGHIITVRKGNGNRFYGPGAIARSLYAQDINETFLVVDGNSLVKISNATSHWYVYDRTEFAGKQLQSGFQDGSLAESRFDKINSFTQSSDGEKIYLTDTRNHCIRLIDQGALANETVSTLIGQCGESGNNETGSFLETRFESPRGITLSADQLTLYISDYYNNRILVADLANELTSVLNLDDSTLYAPVDLALSNNGQELFITLSQRGLYTISGLPTTTPDITLLTNKLRSADSKITLSEDGRLIALTDVDGDQILFYDTVTKLVASFCIPPNFGVTSSSDGWSDRCTVIQPHAVTFATRTMLLVTEYVPKNIRKITLNALAVTTPDPSATNSIDTTTSTTPPLTSKRITLPYPGRQTITSRNDQNRPVTDSKRSSKGKTSPGAIAAGVIVPIALICGLVGALVFVVIRQKRLQQMQHQQMYSRRTRQGGFTGPGHTTDPSFTDALDHRMSATSTSEYASPPSYSSVGNSED